MNMLKFGYEIVLDGLPDIPEFHFLLGSGRPQTRFSSNVVYIFQKSWKCLERHMSGSQACRGSPHGPIEKEICHLKAKKSTKNVNANLSGNLYGAIFFFPRSLRSLGI